MQIGSPAEMQALGFWTLGLKYLSLSELACKEIVSAPDWLITSNSQNDKKLWEMSDHAIPAIFLFFHGVELILKGFNSKFNVNTANHHLTSQLTSFRTNMAGNDAGIFVLLEPFISQTSLQPVLGTFLTKNNLTLNDWYMALRYPESKSGNPYDQSFFKWPFEENKKFMSSIAETAAAIKIKTYECAVNRGWDA